MLNAFNPPKKSLDLCLANTGIGRHSLGHGFLLDCLCFGSQGSLILNPYFVW